jgi:hypothetical protein
MFQDQAEVFRIRHKTLIERKRGLLLKQSSGVAVPRGFVRRGAHVESKAVDPSCQRDVKRSFLDKRAGFCANRSNAPMNDVGESRGTVVEHGCRQQQLAVCDGGPSHRRVSQGDTRWVMGKLTQQCRCSQAAAIRGERCKGGASHEAP